MFSALFTIFYLQSRMEVNFSYFLRPFLQLCLASMAALCSVTRIVDHKHHPTDVAAGVSLGFVFAWLAFYKLGEKVIPNTERVIPAVIKRATSIESEPQTPTPLLRPERLVLNNNLILSHPNQSNPSRTSKEHV